MADIELNFPLVSDSPSDAQYEEICPDGGTRPSCQLKVSAYSGASSPTDTYGDLSVVNLPLEKIDANCKTLVEIWMEPGCPPGTPDMIWDNVYSDDTILQNSSANIGVEDGWGPFEWEIESGYGFSLEDDKTADRTNILYSSSDSCGIVKIKVVDACQTEIIGEVSCEQLPVLEYDWDNSAETCGRPDNIAVSVKGGTPPYIWAVTGVGFSIHSVQTYGLTNIVYADLTACGSAIITVEDLCGTITEGSVRCTASGVWVEIERASNGDEACGVSGIPDGTHCVSADAVCGINWVTRSWKVIGGFRIEEHLGRYVYQGSCSAAAENNCRTNGCAHFISNGCSYCISENSTLPRGTCQILNCEWREWNLPWCRAANYACGCDVVCDRLKYEWKCP